jgi:proteasome accessory factor C
VKQRYLRRLTRLLLLVPAAFRTGDRGLPIERAVRVCGARTVRELEEDVAAAGSLEVGPSMPEDFLDLSIEDGRVYVGGHMRLSEPPPLTLAEGAMLYAALAPFADRAGPAVRTARAKIRKAVPEALRPAMEDLARGVDVQVEPQGEWASALEEAIERRVEATVEYRAESTGTVGRKVLEPRALFPQDGHWYLAAWNVEKGAEHLYRLDRVVSVVLGERVFGEHRGPPLARFRGKPYATSGAERTVRVRFTGAAAARARERWPEAAVEGPDGSVAVETQQVPGNFLLGWVLGHGGQAEVESPPDVRRAFLERVEALRALYGS